MIKPNKATKPQAPIKSRGHFLHQLNQSYLREVVDPNDPVGKLVRFTVFEQVARAGDINKDSKYTVELVKTAKGAFVLYDAANEEAPFRVFHSVAEVRGVLNLHNRFHRELFVALGGSLEAAIPEV
jgi:hypothetical protein